MKVTFVRIDVFDGTEEGWGRALLEAKVGDDLEDAWITSMDVSVPIKLKPEMTIQEIETLARSHFLEVVDQIQSAIRPSPQL